MYRRRRILDGKPVIERYGEWMISVTSDKSRIPNSGGKLIITASAVRYVYWSNDETTEEFGDVTLSNPFLIKHPCFLPSCRKSVFSGLYMQSYSMCFSLSRW